MKVLTATTRTQGARSSDFSYTVAGELVYLGLVCTRDEQDPDSDDACGCARSFVGANSHRATTTAEVADLEMDVTDVELAIGSSLQQSGWATQEDCAATEAALDEMLEIADSYPVGAVLRRRLDEIEW
jgi:hypothetical protein